MIASTKEMIHGNTIGEAMDKVILDPFDKHVLCFERATDAYSI